MGLKYKVLLYAPMHRQGTELLKKKCDLIYAASTLEKDLVDQARDVDAIIFRGSGEVTKAIIESAVKLKVIGKHGVGLNAIDLDAARKCGVKVVNTPAANFQSVAEHFVALAIMLAKKIKLMQRALEAGNWSGGRKLIGTELCGKNLGVLGFGRIGQQTARICNNGFGMNVFYHDKAAYPKTEKELGAKRLDPATLFSVSDFISINLPLFPETRHMVNADLIHHMKPTAFLINMARGPIWNEKDVLTALQENRIAGAGSDVFEKEPAAADNPLLKMDNFVGTPHSAAHTEESAAKASMVANDVLAVLEGREPEFPVV
ncbi:MAG: hydroxyacid dehydrogenase [Thermodesulfobacteriota bacterium]